MLAAAKAVIKPFDIIDVEGGGLFFMERAAAFIFTPRPNKFHPLADNIGQGNARTQFILKGFGKGHGKK